MTTYYEFNIEVGFRFDYEWTCAQLGLDDPDDVANAFLKHLPKSVKVDHSCGLAGNESSEIVVYVKTRKTNDALAAGACVTIGPSIPLNVIDDAKQQLEPCIAAFWKMGLKEIPPMSVVPRWMIG